MANFAYLSLEWAEEGRRRAEAELTPEEVKDWVAANLADYKVPDEVIVRDMLPLTPVGKVQKKVLEEEIRRESEGKS